MTETILPDQTHGSKNPIWYFSIRGALLLRGKEIHGAFSGMAERFNRRVTQILKPIYFKDRQTMAETLHRQVNHYNRRQTQPALGGLTPSGYSNQRKEKEAKPKGKSPVREDPKILERTRVKPGNLPLIRPL